MKPITLGVRGIDQQMLQSFRRNSDRLQTSLERLSTGKRINRPSDDPMGFIAAESFRRELTDLKAKVNSIGSERRASHAAQSDLANIQEALTNLRDRVLSAADSLLATEDSATLRSEIDSAIDAVNRVAKNSARVAAKRIDPEVAELLQAGDALAAEIVDAKNSGVAAERAARAAVEHTQLSVFEHLYQDQVVIFSEALSQIEDTDFAAEAASLAQSQVLTQSAMAALAYSGRSRVDQITQLLDETA